MVQMQKKSSPAALRNREPLAGILKPFLMDETRVLELASGTGEHAAYFVDKFPKVIWQPSDISEDSLASVRAYRSLSDPKRFLAPLDLDTRKPDWSTGEWDLILCCNMIHISPWESCEALFKFSPGSLRQGAYLVLYGPFIQASVETSESNLAFDRSLRDRNPEWGIRSLGKVCELARNGGFVLHECHEMPANNLTVIFKYQP